MPPNPMKSDSDRYSGITWAQQNIPTDVGLAILSFAVWINNNPYIMFLPEISPHSYKDIRDVPDEVSKTPLNILLGCTFVVLNKSYVIKYPVRSCDISNRSLLIPGSPRCTDLREIGPSWAWCQALYDLYQTMLRESFAGNTLMLDEALLSYLAYKTGSVPFFFSRVRTDGIIEAPHNYTTTMKDMAHNAKRVVNYIIEKMPKPEELLSAWSQPLFDENQLSLHLVMNELNSKTPDLYQNTLNTAAALPIVNIDITKIPPLPKLFDQWN